MAEKLVKNALLSVLLCVLFSCSTHSEEDACIAPHPCLCKLSDDRFIDISNVTAKDKYLAVESGAFAYYFFPCEDVQFDEKRRKEMNLVLNGTNDCEKGASLCMYNKVAQNLTNLGTLQERNFTNNLPKLLVYTRSNTSVTTIKLDCTPDDGKSYLALEPNEQTADHHQLVLLSSHSCVRVEQRGLSTGSTLLILFCTGFGIYFLGGALALHLLRGAQGKEMIPNLDFWVDLPYLMRDGIIFLLSGCNPRSLSTVETYDRI